MLRLATAFILVASSATAADECNATLDDVLDRYIDARGGLDAIESQHALRLVSIQHEGKWNPTFDYRVMKPGYMWIAAIYERQ